MSKRESNPSPAGICPPPPPAPPRRRTVVLDTGTSGILGIDPSITGTGLWLLPSGEYWKIAPKTRGVARLRQLRDELVRVMYNHTARVAVVEGYSYASKGGRLAELGEWGGVLRVTLHEIGVKRLIVVPPATLKKFVIGHAKPGQSGKDVMLLKTYKRWGIEIPDADLCDAHGLARAGECILFGEDTQAKRELVKAVRIEEF